MLSTRLKYMKLMATATVCSRIAARVTSPRHCRDTGEAIISTEGSSRAAATADRGSRKREKKERKNPLPVETSCGRDLGQTHSEWGEQEWLDVGGAVRREGERERRCSCVGIEGGPFLLLFLFQSGGNGLEKKNIPPVGSVATHKKDHVGVAT